MAVEHDNTSPEEQALADEWAAALAEAGDASQDDIEIRGFAMQCRITTVGRCRLKLVETSVESTWFQRLKLEYD